jgi:hypothetical protein
MVPGNRVAQVQLPRRVVRPRREGKRNAEALRAEPATERSPVGQRRQPSLRGQGCGDDVSGTMTLESGSAGGT